MGGFGERLREQRERQGVSLESLARETRVQPRHFDALEREAFHELPGGVFRRGIVRAYLGAMRVGEEEWMPEFEAALAEAARLRGERPTPDDDAWVAFAENVRRNRAGTRRERDWRWAGVLVLLLGIAGGGWALWHFELHALLAH